MPHLNRAASLHTSTAASPNLLLGALLCVALCACTGYHDRREVQAPPGVAVPDGFASAQAPGDARADTPDADPAPPPSTWWESFNDPALTATVERALARNLDLHAAWARLEQSKVIASAATVGQWPTMSLDGSTGYSQTAFPIGNQTVQNQNTQYQLSLPVAYELDLWGRVSQRAEAASLDAEASAADLDALAMSLASQTTETWFSITEAQQRASLLRSQRAINQTYLSLLTDRFQVNLATLADIYQQEQQIQAIDAQLALVEGQRKTLEHALSLLLAEPPRLGHVPPSASLPDPPPPPNPGLPAHLLERRPDLRAVRTRIAAADLRIGAAKGDRLPTLRLTASVGLLGINTPNILEILTASLGAAFSLPLLDGGARAYEVERQEAAFQEQLATYGARFLTATREVEDALTLERQQRAYITHLERQLDLSRRALDQLNERYQRGALDYLRILTAVNATQQLELSLLAARRQLLSYRVQLHRALGGDLSTSIPTRQPL